MRGGGTLVGDSTWVTRVRALALGDTIQCQNWNGEWWSGGETLIVITPPTSTGERDGFYEFQVECDDPSNTWFTKTIRPEDRVCLVSREVAEQSAAPLPPPKRSTRRQGLFDDAYLDPVWALEGNRGKKS